MQVGKRIMILGSSGSGKSTLATKLGEMTGLPVIHLDRLFWNPGWVETPSEEMAEKAMAAAAGEQWIIEGNYKRTLDFRIERADTIIFLDFNRFLCMYRVIMRRIKNHGRTRYDLGDDCPEKLDWPFLKLAWSFPMRMRPVILEKIVNCGKCVYHLKTRMDVERFVDALYES